LALVVVVAVVASAAVTTTMLRPAGAHSAGSPSSAADATTQATGSAAPESDVMAPPQLVVLGDSIGGTLGLAIAGTAPAGTQVRLAFNFGCGVATGTWASDRPPQRQMPMFPACNDSEPAAKRWPALDAQAVAQTGPGDVVLYVAGAWECEDILHAGRWGNITEPAFRHYLAHQLSTLVAIATARGAHLELTTLPVVRNATLADSLVRQRLYDRLVDATAALHPRQVSVVDLGHLLSPSGRFVRYLDGVEVRTPDGLHTPSYDPGNPFLDNASRATAVAFETWLGPRIWPQIERAAV
jgi:hypothetical protein